MTNIYKMSSKLHDCPMLAMILYWAIFKSLSIHIKSKKSFTLLASCTMSMSHKKNSEFASFQKHNENEICVLSFIDLFYFFFNPYSGLFESVMKIAQHVEKWSKVVLLMFPSLWSINTDLLTTVCCILWRCTKGPMYVHASFSA